MKMVQWFKAFIMIILVVWTLTLVYFWRCSSSIDNNYINILEKLHVQINGLEQQYKNIIDFSDIIKNLKDLSSMNINKTITNSINSELKISHDPLQEMLRRYTNINLRELLNVVDSLTKDEKLNNQEFHQNLEDRILSLIADVELMSETNISKTLRKLELLKLSNLVQDRIRNIQNPSNCNEAHKLICNLNKGCGFGCQIHHVLYCLILAYSTQRTLILESHNWRYGFKGWEFVFKPLSETCTAYDKSRGYGNWGDPNMYTIQNVLVPIIDTISHRPEFLPQAIPKDIYDKLFYLHGDPFVWFAGQLLSYIMRINNFMNNTLYEFDNGRFSKLHNGGPIVGVHIRRTDKVGTEAQFHPLSEYMIHVEAYFRKEEIKINRKFQLIMAKKSQHLFKPIKLKRQIILATDEPKIFNEMKENYPNYFVIGNPENSRTANVGNRYSQDALQAIIIDTIFLSHTNFLVCTFSSQVCRVSYELMQSYILKSSSGDQGNQFKSLDDIYYFGGQHPNRMVMIQEFHDPQSKFNLQVGDVINVMGNHWNGWSKGVLKNDQVGLFPTYKAQFLHRIALMGNYSVNP